MASYDVQRLSSTNIHHLILLYKWVNYRQVSLGFLIKKYDTRYLGVEFIGFIAYASPEMPIAYYGVIPAKLRINGNDVLSAQSADTMTHPDYQRQGLFVLLAGKTFDLARENGVKFIFGFANENSLPGAIKLGFKAMSVPLQLFKIGVPGSPIAKLMHKLGPSRMLYDAFVGRRLRRLAFPPEELFRNEGHNGVKHDQSFITYKEFSPKYFVKVNGHRLWIKVDRIVKVGFVSLDDDNASAFIDSITNLAKQLGCNEIVFMTQMDSSLYRLLASALTPSKGLPICIRNLTEESYHLEKLTFEYGDIDIF